MRARVISDGGSAVDSASFPTQLRAAEVIEAVLQGRSLTPVLDHVLTQRERPSPSERGALRDIASGTLRHLGLMRALITRLVRRPIDDTLIDALLACALYRLELTRAAHHAVVDQAVQASAQAGRAWAKGLVNAVLRRYLRERSVLLQAAREDPLARYNHPLWWVERLRSDHPSEWESIVAAGNERPLMTLRVNRRRGTRDDYLARLSAVGINGRAIGHDGIVLERPVGVDRLPDFERGLVSVQDYGAQLAAEYLAPHPGARVLDACAAPGGKTAHLLERHDIEVLALDLDPMRVERTLTGLARLALSAQVETADVLDPSSWWDGRPYDRILLDAPCSASGVVRHHPDIKWLRRPTDVDDFATRQRALLEALWPRLAHGGRLLYCTCSVFAAENHRCVDRFIADHADARLTPLPSGAWTHEQHLPNADHDGFYYALLERR